MSAKCDQSIGRPPGGRWRYCLLALVVGLVNYSLVGATTDPIEQAGAYLRQAQEKDGFFKYEYDLIKDRYSSKNNIVRQAGAAYGLAEFYAASPDRKTAETLRRALVAFRESSIPIGDGSLLTAKGLKRNAKAGATALALIAEILYETTSGDRQFNSIANGWGRGLIELYNPGSGFYNKPGKPDESDYANGEIWLALSHWVNHAGSSSELIRILPQVENYLLGRYSAVPSVGFFHWGVMAASKRYKDTGDNRFFDFAVGQTKQYLTKLRPTMNSNSNSCYAVEGMAAVYEILASAGGQAAFKRELMNRIAAEMKKNSKLQIRPDQNRVIFRAGNYLFSSKLKSFSGAFLSGRLRPQLRIDATQHCLSALVKVKKIMED